MIFDPKDVKLAAEIVADLDKRIHAIATAHEHRLEKRLEKRFRRLLDALDERLKRLEAVQVWAPWNVDDSTD